MHKTMYILTMKLDYQPFCVKVWWNYRWSVCYEILELHLFSPKFRSHWPLGSKVRRTSRSLTPQWVYEKIINHHGQGGKLYGLGGS